MKGTVVSPHFSACTLLSIKCPIVRVVRAAGTEPTWAYSSEIPPLCCCPKDACELLLLQCDSSHIYLHSLLSLADFGSAKINILCLVMWPSSIWQTLICFLTSLLSLVFYFFGVVRVGAYGRAASARSAGVAHRIGGGNGWPLRCMWFSQPA